jgi:hypothetical protein
LYFSLYKVATRSSLLRQKIVLHRNLAIPLQDDNNNIINKNNSEGEEFNKNICGGINEFISEQINKLGEYQGELK